MFVTFVSGSMGMFMFKNLGQVETVREGIELFLKEFRPTKEGYKVPDVTSECEFQEILEDWELQKEMYGLDIRDEFEKGDYIWKDTIWIMVGDEGQDLVFGRNGFVDMDQYNEQECDGLNCIEEME